MSTIWPTIGGNLVIEIAVQRIGIEITEYLPLCRTGNGIIKIVDGILSPGGREYLVSSTLIANETESCQNTENSTPTENQRRTTNSTGKKFMDNL